MILPDGTIRHRRRSYNEPNHAHEFTFTCFMGYKLLSQDRTRQWFVNALDRARRKHDVQLWTYVIMPEHVHLTVMPQREEYKTSMFLKSVKQSVGRRAINYLQRHNPQWLERLTVRLPCGKLERHFWQDGGGYDRNIRKVKTLIHSIHYIHANPVRRGLVERPADWLWSSAGWYDGERDVKLKMDPMRIL